MKYEKVFNSKKYIRKIEGMGEGLVLFEISVVDKRIGQNYHLFYEDKRKPPLDIAINPEDGMIEYISYFVQDEMINNISDRVSLLSFESLYCIGGYVTFEILVSTSGFAGNCNFCIGEKTIQDYTNCLDTMISLLDGEVIIRDCESDAFLKFYFENNMNLYVLGQIGGSHEDNMLKFKMKADQTVLLGLKNSLLDY